MPIKKHDHPGYGWLALAALVAAADLTGNRTMSDVFRAASRHPVGGPVVAVGWGVLSAHLFGLLEPRLDPFHWLACNPRTCPHATRNSRAR